jgi:hypothetical protein
MRLKTWIVGAAVVCLAAVGSASAAPGDVIEDTGVIPGYPGGVALLEGDTANLNELVVYLDTDSSGGYSEGDEVLVSFDVRRKKLPPGKLTGGGGSAWTSPFGTF